MTDEQLGRLWCERNGKRPDANGRYYDWYPPRVVGASGPHNLSFNLHPAFHGHESEAAAYAAVGAALRKVVTLADEVRTLEVPA